MSSKKDMIARINKRLEVYFYDYEIEKVDEYTQKIFDEGQKETMQFIKKAKKKQLTQPKGE